MNLLAICSLSLAALQSPQTDEAAIRELAWQLHLNPPTAAELMQRWQQPGQDQDLLLHAASRGLADQECVADLLVTVLTQQQAGTPSPALTELLLTAASNDDAVPLLQDVLSRPEWRSIASDTLLRWGIYPAQAEHVLAADLLAKLANGFIPNDANLAASLRLGSGFRDALLPSLLTRYDFSDELCQNLSGLSRATWTPFQSLLLDAVLANQQLARPDSSQLADPKQLVSTAWKLYLQPDLALGQKQLLEQIMTQYGDQASVDMLKELLASSNNDARPIALDFLNSKPMACGVPLLLSNALDPNAVAESRGKSIQALFQIASEAELQQLTQLLNPELDGTLKRAILVGLRLRPLELVPGTIEALLPKLRTNDAGLAMEVLMLTADHSTRMSWIPKLGALPENVSRRAVQMAWGVDPHPEIRDLFLQYSQAKHPSRRALASAGLRAALSEEELAAHYQGLLKSTSDPQLFDEYLNELRDQRNDAALEVILEWLISPGGRANPRSAAFASLLIEEELANPMFESWWQNPQGLNDFQLDWSACQLSPTHADARQRLHERFDEVPARSQNMFLTRMKEGAGQKEVDLWNRVLTDFDYDLSVRRVAAHLLFRAAQEQNLATAAEWIAPSRDALLSSNEARYADRAWVVFARGMAAYPDLPWRQQWLQAMRELPAEYSQRFVRACYQGFADQSLEEQLPALQQAWLEEIAKPEFGSFLAQTRPTYQQVADRYFDFFYLSLAINAHQPSAEQDQQLAAQVTSLGTSALADCLSLLAPAMTDWTQTGSAAKQILKASERSTSFRFPPKQSAASKRPMASYLVNNDYFNELRVRYDAGELQGLSEACLLAIHRWPRDRRSHLWQGWVALSQSKIDLAEQAFEQGLALSGWMEYVRMEPQLGLAAVNAIRTSDWDGLSTYLKRHQQTDNLLRGRTVHGLLPKLSEVAGPAD